MTAWTNDELDRIGAAEELDLASQRADGTLRKAVTMWVVRIDDDLYVRAYKGLSGPWFRGAQTRHAGQIRSGGVEKEVTFIEETDPVTNDRISAAYQTKYSHYPEYVLPMLTAEARTGTIKLVPRE